MNNFNVMNTPIMKQVQADNQAGVKPITDFTNSLHFIFFFLIGVLVFSMIFGEKVTTVYLWLVLAGMLIVNADKTVSLLNSFSHSTESSKNHG